MLTVQISVRHLVEFILRSGSIDSGFFISNANRALEGTKVHQRIQKIRKAEVEDAGGEYYKEVHMRGEYERGGISFRVEGRADGLVVLDGKITGKVIIEEIKSTMRPLSDQLVRTSDQLHWAQAKCYAYIYAQKHGLENISCDLIYGHVETGEWITLTETYTYEVLEAFLFDLLDRYAEFARLDADRIEAARRTGIALAFPFESYREGQREMAVSIYAAIKHKKKLFAQAPTGIGKTMAALFSAVKAMAEGMGEKIFYITSKNVQRHLAEDALSRMKGLEIRSITLTAKDKICFRESRNCNPEHCENANGHFDRINAAILDCIGNECAVTRAVVEQYAQKHMVCPSEYALDLSIFCHIIICDYNHVYDPKAKLRRFFQDKGDFILLQDEAHNLVDRGREMFSAGVHRKEFAALRKELGRKHPLYKPLGAVAKSIREHSGVESALMHFAAACEGHNEESVLPVYFSTLDYLRVADLADSELNKERYTAYQEPDYIRLFCLDPSYLLAQEQKKSRTCVFFSATLTPLPYFQGILGGGDGDYLIRLGSPFPRENLCLVVEGRISTKYKHRNQTAQAVAESLYDMVKGRVGNYMAFFPSYAYLEQVYDIFCYDDVLTVRQLQGETTGEFLDNFEADSKSDKSVLGFAVLGGAFSEGIDLAGERLIGAAVIGVGMPQISPERDLIAGHFNFKYAYVYPGMNKVLQAAGRVIRTESDKGVVLLIDSRYHETEYKELFPPEWAGYFRLSGQDRLEDVLRGFWSNTL